jgi:hypothetical protein
MELFREQHKTRIRRLPEYGVFLIIPGEYTLLIRREKHPRREVPPHCDDITRLPVRNRKGKALVFVEIGKIGIRPG